MHDFSYLLAPWIHETLGVPQIPIQLLAIDSDWSFVIKIHALVETALNKLVVSALKLPQLAAFVSFLDVGDRRRGKMAIIKALELLPSNARKFLVVLSNLRNDLAHDATFLHFEFENWKKIASKETLTNFRESAAFALKDEFTIRDERITRDEFVDAYPRDTIDLCAMTILAQLFRKEQSGRDQSIPKESEQPHQS